MGFCGLEFFQMEKQCDEGQNAGNALCQEGCPCHTCYAHIKGNDEKQVQGDIPQRGTNEEIQGCSGVPQRRKDACAYVIQKQEQES